jgi:hypothetical protein
MRSREVWELIRLQVPIPIMTTSSIEKVTERDYFS